MELKIEDKRLERLFDYTKFHIGIYLSAGGGLVTLIGFSAKAEESTFIAKLIGLPISLAVSLALMVVAGMAGGIIASSCTECVIYSELWDKPHGPFGLKLLRGRFWAAIEHGAFWLSAFAFGYAILSAPAVRIYLVK